MSSDLLGWVLGIVGAGILVPVLTKTVAWVIAAVAERVVDRMDERMTPRLQERWSSDLENHLAPIRKELSINSGTSVKDAINAVRRDVAEIKGTLNRL